ncbi:MAG: 1-(5-phosphoribosyl)-5-[(5-phosphoribosylamino)methylideneamino] imidazole-4-carboxamide isomerase [Acidobacteriaceae bacterium]|nr:1-(5-phosphoribosyl)-5-[(5-phosphoribosylamino)methylideneamino] imidazole-4-carboxamide isomerase [Acidobacteriaceae bacterium]
MIIPCIDLMDGKVVQLVQGRDKVLEGLSPEETLAQFSGFDEIQVIDLDAAMGKGSNAQIVEHLAAHAKIRAGGGVRTVSRACELIKRGAHRVIIGTAAFSDDGINTPFLTDLQQSIGPGRVTIALDSKAGRVVVKGWKEATPWTAVEIVGELERYCSGFLCTYVDKEGLMQGTDLNWFERLRKATSHELIAAGGITTMDDVRALTGLGIHCAIGMAIYTGRLPLDELRSLNKQEASR